MAWEYMFGDTRAQLREIATASMRGATLCTGPTPWNDRILTGRKRQPERNINPTVDTTRLCGYVCAWRPLLPAGCRASSYTNGAVIDESLGLSAIRGRREHVTR